MTKLDIACPSAGAGLRDLPLRPVPRRSRHAVPSRRCVKGAIGIAVISRLQDLIMHNVMLDINDLHVKLDDEDREILKGLSLTVKPARCTPSWGRTARASRRSPMCWRAAKTTR